MAKNEFGRVQREQYDKLPEEVKKDVDDGYGVVVCDLESQTTICKFNMDKRCITDEQVEVLAEIFLPEIIEFYKDEKNKKKMAEAIQQVAGRTYRMKLRRTQQVTKTENDPLSQLLSAGRVAGIDVKEN